MYRTLTVVEARQNFAQTLKRVSEGESLLISRRGKPLAVVISPSEAIRYFRFRADEIEALVEENQAQNGTGQEPGYEVAEETPTPATATADELEGEFSEPTIDEGFRPQIEEFIGKCHVAGTPAEAVVSEVLRICGQFGVTEEIAERLVARTYTERE